MGSKSRRETLRGCYGFSKKRNVSMQRLGCLSLSAVQFYYRLVYFVKHNFSDVNLDVFKGNPCGMSSRRLPALRSRTCPVQLSLCIC